VNGRFSDFYKFLLGVLQGDPISPILFVVYMSALRTGDPDDPTLSGIPIPKLMLADDVTLVSTSAAGMQRKLEMLEQFYWQRRVLLHIKDKTKSLVLGQATGAVNVALKLCGELVESITAHTVNGFPVCATEGSWDCRPHILGKLAAAKKISNCIIAL
jgi:hypothetical protein